MNTHIKNVWVTALRSGDWKKCKYQLKDCDGHVSPAGILCELAVEAGIIQPPKDLTQKTGRTDPVFFGWTYDGLATGIPEAVAKWAELPYRSAYSLDLKSDHGMTFEQCADYIKERF